jgi:hypothetical protein
MEESRRGSRQKPSYICSILRAPNEKGENVPDGVPIALLFADSSISEAFGDQATATALAKHLADVAYNNGLRQRLKVLRSEISKYSASIRLQD